MTLQKYILKEEKKVRLKGIGFHVTHEKNIDDIKEEGLNKKYNYIWKYEKYAEWFKEFNEEDGGFFVIIEVVLDNYNWTYDTETEDMYIWSSSFSEGENGYGYYTKQKIRPEDIIL